MRKAERQEKPFPGFLLSSSNWFAVAVAWLLFLFFLCGPATADEAPSFTLYTASGEMLKGPIRSIDDHWHVQLRNREAATAILGLERTALPRPGRPKLPYLVLANGDFLPGEVSELGSDAIRIKADLGTEHELKLPLSAVSLIWFAAPDGTDHPDQLRRKLAAAQRSKDAVLLRNGDVVEGVLDSVNAIHVLMEIDKKFVSVELSKVAVVALNTDLVRVPAVVGPHAQLVLTNGARLTVTETLAGPQTLKAKLSVTGTVKIPLSKVAALDLFKSGVVYLSELKPTKYESRSFSGDQSWPLGVNANAWHGDLRLGDSTYDRGLGTRPYSRLSYDLSGKYARFEAIVGLDPRGPDKAAARVQLLLDGKSLDQGGELSHRRPARRISADVRGAKELTLIVDWPREVGATIGDVNWANARLMKD